MEPLIGISGIHDRLWVEYVFMEQAKAWGAHMSYAYVAEPQTNGISERFIRTLKEQVIHGKIYRNVEELRQAIGDFVKKYNSQWLLERLHYVAPRDARRRYNESADLTRAA